MGEKTRTIAVDYLARVEGEGSLTIKLQDGKATEVRLAIFEPPRFFEALLVGRDHTEAPDITSRICGICPVAYLMSACLAMEDALGIVMPEPLRALRRLLYCGEWIESHGLHVFLLHAPDFLGYPDAVQMARDHRSWVQKGLSLKKAGNAIVTMLGGREIHPVNIRVGGFYRAPTKAELAVLLPDLRQGKADAIEALGWVASFPFPEVSRDYTFVALQDADRYAVLEGRVVSNRGLDIPVSEWDAHFVESQAPYSTALRATLRTGEAYLCGPLARFNLSHDRLFPEVQALAKDVGLSVPCTNPFRSIVARMLEVVQAFEEAIRIIEAYVPPEQAWVAPKAVHAATGRGVTEAPRGLLYHRYVLDEAGSILEAQIVPPTSQNQLSIEADLVAIAKPLSELPMAEATVMAEQAVRNHDPCISCATHFLTLNIEAT